MNSYPIAFDVRNKLVVVVGGGRVSTRRVARLLRAGADVRVIAPQLTEDLRGEAEAGRLQWVDRGYRAGDLDSATLVLAATDDSAVNRRVANTARRAGIPVNVADRQTDGDFAIPALVELGPLRLAIETGGAGPAISAALRRHLTQSLSDGWARGTTIAAALRPLIADRADQATRATFWRQYAAGLPDAVTKESSDVMAWLEEIAESAGLELPPFDLPASK